MSLIALAWKHYPRYPLLLLANREEFYDRPTTPLQRWDGDPPFYSGKDLRVGGTWLGIGESGRFAAVTDFRWHIEPSGKQFLSRGQLVTEFLNSALDPEEFLTQTHELRERCLPHNLLVGDTEKLYYACSVSHAIEELSPGVHSVGDFFLDSRMPKCRYVHKHLESLLIDTELSPEDREEMFEVLTYPMRFPEEDLPSRGYPADIERELSPVFLDLGEFGTVSSSVLSLDVNGHVIFSERPYQEGKPGQTLTQEFDLVKDA
ncbi:MAG: NRDE family protein [Candidatus Sericytochromatia bacterium]